jgi:hypothetical protein
MLDLGFARCPLEHGVYCSSTCDKKRVVGVYVDDMIIRGSKIAKFNCE